MSDIPAETTKRLADYLIARYGIEEAAQLIKFTFARTEFGDGKYGRPLLPFDGRNTTRDALDEATDLSQYLMKRVMENEAIADLLERIYEYFNGGGQPYANDLLAAARDTAALLRADCERSVLVESYDDELIRHYAEDMGNAILGPAERLALMEGES